MRYPETRRISFVRLERKHDSRLGVRPWGGVFLQRQLGCLLFSLGFMMREYSYYGTHYPAGEFIQETPKVLCTRYGTTRYETANVKRSKLSSPAVLY